FRVGRGIFRKIWVSSPSSTLASDGLGPLYNARSCQRCHINDGRGHAPETSGENAISFLLRVAVPDDSTAAKSAIRGHLATRGDPTYGGQLQDFGLPGIPAEYTLDLTYEEFAVPMAGGEVAMLRRPRYGVRDLAYGPLDPQAGLSPRVAPQMIGLGLLEAVPAADILALADPDDADGDGVSGRPNVVWSREFGAPMLGRFGHKAIVATLREQTAGAFSGDIGLSTTLFPDPAADCTLYQTSCRNAPHGDTDARGVEVDDETLDLVTFYAQNLGVPARRGHDLPEVLRGKRLFFETGCNACHKAAFVTHRMPDRPEHSFQLIWPYTDLLLHDMGPGLADPVAEGRASGREWRTPPLWGIGLTARASGHTQFLHDGRARSILEAVLWHGGEAARHRDRVTRMTPEERRDLIAFLESL
ncbi:MAG: di-heme oxidoredictase family protein, partial [Pseudomonadota bacterium]